MDGTEDKEVPAILAAALDGTLTEAQAGRLAAIDPQMLKLALLAAAKGIAELRAKLGGSAQPVIMYQPCRGADCYYPRGLASRTRTAFRKWRGRTSRSSDQRRCWRIGLIVLAQRRSRR